MSNNNNNSNNSNPHGHTNQPAAQNPSWNPLQIPSYIPRQPQLAHMSNERPMVRSPLAWHAPAPPPDSLYNFMSANHKNLDHQISPLLPPYVRGPSPFDSMDLSVQSSRSSSSPLNKSGGSHNAVLPHEFAAHKQSQQASQHTHAGQHGQQQAQSQQQQQQQQAAHPQQTQIHAPNNYSIHLPPSSPHGHPQSHQQQLQQQQQQRSQAQTNTANINPHIMQQTGGSGSSSTTSTKYLSSNGGDCEMLPPPVTLAISGGSHTGPNQTTGSGANSSGSTEPSAQYMRESEANIQENYAKITAVNRNYENERQSKVLHKPVELVNKDCNYTMSSNKLSHHQQQQQQQSQQQQQQVSPKKHSPLRNYHTPQQLYNSPHTSSSISQNGPHTPPTPQSPVAQQQMPAATSAAPTSTSTSTNPASTSTNVLQQLNDIRMMSTAGAGNLLDYNQLHLQHNNSYVPHTPPTHGHQTQTQTHQQQQQQSPHHHHQQHHHNQQQLQQPLTQTQPQPPSQHSASLGNHGLRQSQQMQQQQQQQTHHHHHHHQHHQHQQQQVSTAASLTPQIHLDIFTSQSNTKMKELEMAKTSSLSDLSVSVALPNRSATAAATSSHLRPAAATGCFGTRNASSPDNNVTSNDDSVDSNSNSSRGRRKRKPNKLARASSNDSELDDENVGNVCVAVGAQAEGPIRHEIKKPQLLQIGQEQQREREPIPPPYSLSNTSPKLSADSHQGTPSKTEILSPRPLESTACCPSLPTDHHHTLPPSLSSGAAEPATDTNRCLPPDSGDDNAATNKQTVENGCPATARRAHKTKSEHDADVETIDKIAEMIAKTSASGQEVHNSNSCSSADRSGGGGGGGSCLNIGSPKTKKQRQAQALKLRNAEQQNSNSNCSTNSNSYNESLPDGGGAANDNAVLAEELRKEDHHKALAAGVLASQRLSNPVEQVPIVPISAISTLPAATMRPLSPPNFSRSCSSSSTSSTSCSNSSRSSCIREENKLKAPAEAAVAVEVRAVEKTEQDIKNLEKQSLLKSCEGNECRVTEASTVVAGDGDGDGAAAAVAAGACHVTSPKRETLKYDVETEMETKNLLIKDCKDDKKQLLKSPAKSCFEEVENKLEEMFAGIEDEPPPPPAVDDNSFPTSSNVSEVASDLNLVLELATPAAINSPASIKNNKLEPPASLSSSLASLSSLPAKTEKTPPTKAAKKSTIPSPVKIANANASVVAPPTRITPPRRRLSMLVEPSNIIESGTRSSRATITIDDQPTTSAAAAAAAAADAAAEASLSKSTQDCSNSPKKQYKTKNIQRGFTMPKSKGSSGNGPGTGGGGGGNKSGKGKFNNKKQSQQQSQKKHKGKQQDSEDDEATPAQRDSNGAGNGNVGGGGGSGGANDGKYKSPYILVKNDGSVSVINAPTAEDVGAEKQTKVKKAVSQHRGYAQDRKNLRGMHSSTLSNKYDADTADKTWVCVFCKRGPHRMGLGDLFGPYMISTDCEEYRMAVGEPGALDLDAVMANKRRRVDMVQWHPRNLPVVPASGIGSHGACASKRLGGGGGGYNKKKKKSIDELPLFGGPNAHPLPAGDWPALMPINTDAEMHDAVDQVVVSGMCKASESTYEVWLHEDCAVWAPAVFLVGARVMGLDAAVWNSTRYHCAICGKAGAMLCCLQRECHAAAHIPCARETQWKLNESDFKVFCHKHSNTSCSEKQLAKGSNPANTSAATTTTTSTSSVLAELLNRPPPKPTSSNLQSRRYS